MPVLKQPFSLKEIFGRLRQVFILKEDSSSADPGTERQIEGRDGALKVFLSEDLSSGTAKVQVDTREILEQEILVWLKIIAFHLAELRGEHILPDDIAKENYE